MSKRDKRFRVSGLDAEGDIHAFETDSRERARVVEAHMKEDLTEVVFDVVRRV